MLSIDELVEDLTPVRRLRLPEGLAIAGGAFALTLAGVGLLLGFNHDLRDAPIAIIAAGLLLVLALAAGLTAVDMAMPGVGRNRQGWRWPGLTLLILPLLAIASSWKLGRLPLPSLNDAECIGSGLLAATLIFAALVAWLRRGAPVSPERAGLISGVAAGAGGLFAYALHCPIDDLVHVGLWHMVTVPLAGAAGRMIGPPLLRW